MVFYVEEGRGEVERRRCVRSWKIVKTYQVVILIVIFLSIWLLPTTGRQVRRNDTVMWKSVALAHGVTHHFFLPAPTSALCITRSLWVGVAGGTKLNPIRGLSNFTNPKICPKDIFRHTYRTMVQPRSHSAFSQVDRPTLKLQPPARQIGFVGIAKPAVRELYPFRYQML